MKKLALRKTSARKPTAGRRNIKKVAPKRATALRPPAGYAENAGGRVIVPVQHVVPVAPGKIQEGLEKANRAISKMIGDFAKLMNDEYAIKEIEFSISFDAEGKFLGIGVGGSASIKVRIAPMPH